MLFEDFLAWFVDTSSYLITNYGYLGVFLVGFMGSATVFLPIPSYAVVFLAATNLNPFLLGIIAGLGASVGELVGYTLGRGGRRVIEKRDHFTRDLNKIESMFQKYGGFLTIIIVAATPLPDNVLGIFCGMIKYPVKKYFIASTTGKIIMHLIIAYAGYYSISFLVKWFGIAF